MKTLEKIWMIKRFFLEFLVWNDQIAVVFHVCSCHWMSEYIKIIHPGESFSACLLFANTILIAQFANVLSSDVFR